TPLAVEIANASQASGMEPLTTGELAGAKDMYDALWDALTESRALFVVLPSTGPTPSMAVEIGAARAWNKPIFAIVRDPSSAQASPVLSGVRLYPIGGVDDALNTIKRSAAQLSEN